MDPRRFIKILAGIAVVLVPGGIWFYKSANTVTDYYATEVHNEKALINNELVDTLTKAVSANEARISIFRMAVDPTADDSNRRGALALLELLEEKQTSDLDEVQDAFTAVDLGQTEASAEVEAASIALLDTYRSFNPTYEALLQDIIKGQGSIAQLHEFVETRLVELEQREQAALQDFETARQTFMSSDL